MGFDTSFHPLDLPLLRGRVLPYLRGEVGPDGIDDLVEEAVRLRGVRFRAKAWALGAHKAGRVGRRIVWGRPFFVPTADAAAIGLTLDRWLAVPRDGVDDLARELLGGADVVPDEDGFLPEDDELRATLRHGLDLVRLAVSRPGGDVEVADGSTMDADGLVARELPLVAVEFLAHLRPGWMARGVWPSDVLAAGKADPSRWFDAPAFFFEGIEVPEPFVFPTIVENTMVGGWVAPEKVGDLHGVLARNLDKIGDEWAREEMTSAVEALAEAHRLGFGLVEASEIYEGMRGTLN